MHACTTIVVDGGKVCALLDEGHCAGQIAASDGMEEANVELFMIRVHLRGHWIDVEKTSFFLKEEGFFENKPFQSQEMLIIDSSTTSQSSYVANQFFKLIKKR